MARGAYRDLSGTDCEIASLGNVDNRRLNFNQLRRYIQQVDQLLVHGQLVPIIFDDNRILTRVDGNDAAVGFNFFAAVFGIFRFLVRFFIFAFKKSYSFFA